VTSSALSRVADIRNLKAIWNKYWKNTQGSNTAGIDDVTPRAFHEQQDKRIEKIHHELRTGYRFSNLRGIAVPKTDPTKLRLICIPTVSDRVVQRALLSVIEEHSERLGITNEISFGFVRSSNSVKRGVGAALIRAKTLRAGAPWAFKADITSFFDTIRRDSLIKDFCKSFRHPSLNNLIAGAVNCEVIASGIKVESAIKQNNIVEGRGLRQGMPLSPILSNFYLRHFDSKVSRRHQILRYADDLIVFANSLSECEDAAAYVTETLDRIGLHLSPTKTRIYQPDQAVEFLGMELRLDDNNKCRLEISDRQIREIRAAFREYNDIYFVVENGLNIMSLLVRLENMQAGYGAAYGKADNFKILKGKIQDWKRDCIVKIYTQIFGKNSLDKITDTQRKFLFPSISI